MLKDNIHVPSMSDFNDIVQQMLLNPNGHMQQLQLAFEHEDNEYVHQTMLTTLQVFVGNPIMRQILGSMGNLNDLIDSINIGMTAMGYIMHHRQIARSELKNYIYYARLTPDGRLLRSNYHPIHLMEFMNADEIPESFQKLYSDRDYLPNIMSVWDRGSTDSLLLISFQKVNIHIDINGMINEANIDVLSGGITSLLGSLFGTGNPHDEDDEDDEGDDLD